MRATLVVVLSILLSAACGSSPSSPSALSPSSAAPAARGTLVLSGVVYVLDAAGRRPLAGATVEITESQWGDYSRATTDALGRYVFTSLPARHYLARASKAGYDESAILSLGYLERSRTLDFDLTPAGLTGPLAIAAIEPTMGSTGGGTTVRITGTGFLPGTTVTFGGERGDAFIPLTTTLYVTTPVHSAATVDVVLTRPNGEAATLTRAFTYAPPQSFNFNGTWEGYALAYPASGARLTPLHSDMEMGFTIQDDVLTGFRCGGAAIQALSPLPSARNGEFSLVPNSVSITGRIVSADSAIGTIDTVACPATQWFATRR